MKRIWSVENTPIVVAILIVVYNNNIVRMVKYLPKTHIDRHGHTQFSSEILVVVLLLHSFENESPSFLTTTLFVDWIR